MAFKESGGRRVAMPALEFPKRQLEEAAFSFRAGKLIEGRFFYFSRGDSGALREEEFEALLAAITTELSAFSGKPPEARGRDPGNVVKAQGRIWDMDQRHFLLEWNATKASRLRAIPFRAEYIRLSVLKRAAPGATPLKSRDIVKSFVGPDHIERCPTRGFNLDKCFAQMNPEILKKVRMKSGADYEKFKRDIQRANRRRRSSHVGRVTRHHTGERNHASFRAAHANHHWIQSLDK